MRLPLRQGSCHSHILFVHSHTALQLELQQRRRHQADRSLHPQMGQSSLLVHCTEQIFLAQS